MDNDGLSDVFDHIGDVLSAKVITDNQTGRSKGFGFVDLENSEQAKEAIDTMNGHEVEGRALKVAPANSPK